MIEFRKNLLHDCIEIVLIMARYRGKWIYCKNGNGYECPGGHVERDEHHYDAACRELREETGAMRYDLTFLSFFSLNHTLEFGEREVFGACYFADVHELGQLCHEVEQIEFFEHTPEILTYPQTQKALEEKCVLFMGENGN